MMGNQLIWLHDKALSQSHPALDELNESTRVIHVWDDAYYQSRSYSLKRLVFIYETLCELPVEIIHGNTTDVLQTLRPDKLIIPYTADTFIKKLSDELSQIAEVEIVKEKPFVAVAPDEAFKRFFKYWNKAKKTAFLINGEDNAPRS